MEVKKVKTAEGYHWYGCAWALFKGNWGLWLVMSLVIMILTGVLGLVPFIGTLITNLLLPVLVGGFLLAARRVEEGGSPGVGALFSPFGESSRLNPLILLGLFALLANLTLGGVTMLSVGQRVMEAMMNNTPIDLQTLLTPGAVVGLVVALLLAVIVTMAFLYAVPLVVFDKVKPLTSLRLSLVACWKNMGALTLFGLIYLVLALVATLPLGLGLILLFPYTLLALYCSYRALFN